MRRCWPSLVMMWGCYAATPPAGVPCDPASAVCPSGQECLATETGFACLPSGTPPFVDAGPDALPIPVECPGNPFVSVCLDFNAPTLTTPLVNEGATPISIDFVDVERIAKDGGGAAGLGATSEMAVPANTTVTNILAAEAQVRIDAAIPDGMRMGILDSDDASPGFSVFVFGGPVPRLRCNMGDVDLFVDLTLTLGTWMHVACTCEDGNVTAYVDGVKLGSALGCLPSNPDSGVQIGQNSNSGAMLPPDDHLIGALDDVMLWTRLPN